MTRIYSSAYVTQTAHTAHTVLTGGHFVVGSGDPVARHSGALGGVLPLVLGGRPVTG